MIELRDVTSQFPGKRNVVALDAGNLDTRTGEEILRLIRDVHTCLGSTVVIVTHDMKVAESCERTIALRDGRVEQDLRR